jgi:hypothetical protein
VRELAQGLNFVDFRERPGLPGETTCSTAYAYGMGFRVARDCALGTTLAHGGGYPGYGSFLLLLPDYGVGVFAFANRTYAGPAPPVYLTALAIQRAGLLKPRTTAVSEALLGAYRAVRAMYGAGTIRPGRAQLATNFLMDRSEQNWMREFARLRSAAGACRTDAPIAATGALAGHFRWDCERADLEGEILLAPTAPPTIQALRFDVE